jgi:cytochrome c oxidase cbb3-type subunit 3
MPTKIEKDSLTGTETTGHEWDGIKELNTPLPKWWLYVFYACIIFAIGYCIAYPSFPLPWGGHTTGLLNYTNRKGLEIDLKRAEIAKGPMTKRIDEASLDTIRHDPALLEFAVAGGRSAFAQNCVPCHGAGGQGAPGYPNLVDDVWLWGGSLDDIYQTIRFGVRNANPDSRQVDSMPAWGDAAKNPPQVLTASQIDDAANFVLSMNGKSVDKAAADRGSAIFADNCVACHGETASGNPDMGAPPLNAGVWLYGGDKATLVQTITHGRGGQMPAWSERLDGATVKMLAVYVHQLGGGK